MASVRTCGSFSLGGKLIQGTIIFRASYKGISSPQPHAKSKSNYLLLGHSERSTSYIRGTRNLQASLSFLFFFFKCLFKQISKAHHAWCCFELISPCFKVHGKKHCNKLSSARAEGRRENDLRSLMFSRAGPLRNILE